MKRHILFAATLSLFCGSNAAFALSTERASSYNDNGTAKYADPDEQTPRGLVSPDAYGSQRAGPLTGPSVNGPSVSQMVGTGTGNAAFDQAYTHLQNQNH